MLLCGALRIAIAEIGDLRACRSSPSARSGRRRRAARRFSFSWYSARDVVGDLRCVIFAVVPAARLPVRPARARRRGPGCMTSTTSADDRRRRAIDAEDRVDGDEAAACSASARLGGHRGRARRLGRTRLRARRRASGSRRRSVMVGPLAPGSASRSSAFAAMRRPGPSLRLVRLELRPVHQLRPDRLVRPVDLGPHEVLRRRGAGRGRRRRSPSPRSRRPRRPRSCPCSRGSGCRPSRTPRR